MTETSLLYHLLVESGTGMTEIRIEDGSLPGSWIFLVGEEPAYVRFHAQVGDPVADYLGYLLTTVWQDLGDGSGGVEPSVMSGVVEEVQCYVRSLGLE